jgi:hypothetical protein
MYLIRHDGGVLYEVYFSQHICTIRCMRTKRSKKFTYLKCFIGRDPLRITIGWKKEFIGNSILLQVGKTKYMFIGAFLYTFCTSEPIIKYYSPVGNSGVPYPYSRTAKYTYLHTEKKKILNSALDTSKDPYAQYYDQKLPATCLTTCIKLV